MRVGILNDLQGQEVGRIIEQDDGAIIGEGIGVRLVKQAPGKTFEDWESHLHHSSYLRFLQEAPKGV